MQLGGIGSGYGSNTHQTINHNPGGIVGASFHDKSMHHITNCIQHNHSSSHLEGAMKTGGSGGSVPSVPTVGQQAQTDFSLAEWLADPLGSTKKLLSAVWRGSSENGNGNGVNGVAGQISDGREQILAQVMEEEAVKSSGLQNSMNGSAGGQHNPQPAAETSSHVLHAPQVAAAATGIQQPASVQNNPYFAAVESGEKQQNLLQKVRMRFHSAANFLTKKFSFSGRFSGKNSFQTKQERPKEDLRKRSRYREDKLEIECVLTDDSYLLDSYDRKGGYSQLSTRG